jgi:hypothetical protein
MSPVAVKAPVEGSYSSALVPADPPAIKTLPSASNVAVWPVRGVIMEPVVVKIPVDRA